MQILTPPSSLPQSLNNTLFCAQKSNNMSTPLFENHDHVADDDDLLNLSVVSSSSSSLPPDSAFNSRPNTPPLPPTQLLPNRRGDGAIHPTHDATSVQPHFDADNNDTSDGDGEGVGEDDNQDEDCDELFSVPRRAVRSPDQNRTAGEGTTRSQPSDRQDMHASPSPHRSSSPSSHLLHIPTVSWCQTSDLIVLKVFVRNATSIRIFEQGAISSSSSSQSQRPRPSSSLRFCTPLITISCVGGGSGETSSLSRRHQNNAQHSVNTTNNDEKFQFSFHPYGRIKNAAMAAYQQASLTNTKNVEALTITDAYFRIAFRKRKQRQWPRLTFESSAILSEIIRRQYEDEDDDEDRDVASCHSSQSNNTSTLNSLLFQHILYLPHKVTGPLSSPSRSGVEEGAHDDTTKKKKKERYVSVLLGYDWDYEQAVLRKRRRGDAAGEDDDDDDGEEESADSDLCYDLVSVSSPLLPSSRLQPFSPSAATISSPSPSHNASPSAPSSLHSPFPSQSSSSLVTPSKMSILEAQEAKLRQLTAQLAALTAGGGGGGQAGEETEEADGNKEERPKMNVEKKKKHSDAGNQSLSSSSDSDLDRILDDDNFFYFKNKRREHALSLPEQKSDRKGRTGGADAIEGKDGDDGGNAIEQQYSTMETQQHTTMKMKKKKIVTFNAVLKQAGMYSSSSSDYDSEGNAVIKGRPLHEVCPSIDAEESRRSRRRHERHKKEREAKESLRLRRAEERRKRGEVKNEKEEKEVQPATTSIMPRGDDKDNANRSTPILNSNNANNANHNRGGASSFLDDALRRVEAEVEAAAALLARAAAKAEEEEEEDEEEVEQKKKRNNTDAAIPHRNGSSSHTASSATSLNSSFSSHSSVEGLFEDEGRHSGKERRGGKKSEQRRSANAEKARDSATENDPFAVMERREAKAQRRTLKEAAKAKKAEEERSIPRMRQTRGSRGGVAEGVEMSAVEGTPINDNMQKEEVGRGEKEKKPKEDPSHQSHMKATTAIVTASSTAAADDGGVEVRVGADLIIQAVDDSLVRLGTVQQKLKETLNISSSFSSSTPAVSAMTSSAPLPASTSTSQRSQHHANADNAKKDDTTNDGHSDIAAEDKDNDDGSSSSDPFYASSSTDVSSLNSEELEEDFTASIAEQLAGEQGMKVTEAFYDSNPVLKRAMLKKQRRADQMFRRALRALQRGDEEGSSDDDDDDDQKCDDADCKYHTTLRAQKKMKNVCGNKKHNNKRSSKGKGSLAYQKAAAEEYEQRQIFKALRMYARLVDEEDEEEGDDEDGERDYDGDQTSSPQLNAAAVKKNNKKRSELFLRALERRNAVVKEERAHFAAKLKEASQQLQQQEEQQTNSKKKKTEGLTKKDGDDAAAAAKGEAEKASSQRSSPPQTSASKHSSLLHPSLIVTAADDCSHNPTPFHPNSNTMRKFLRGEWWNRANRKRIARSPPVRLHIKLAGMLTRMLLVLMVRMPTATTGANNLNKTDVRGGGGATLAGREGEEQMPMATLLATATSPWQHAIVFAFELCVAFGFLFTVQQLIIHFVFARVVQTQ